MSDIFEEDIFQEAGLTSVTTEEKVAFVQEFGRLLGITGLGKAGDDLSEKDQDTLMRLMMEGEDEQMEAFLTSRNIDLRTLIEAEAMRIRAAIATSDAKYSSLEELLMAVKAQFPASTHEFELMNVTVDEALKAEIDALPVDEDSKNKLIDMLLKIAFLEVQTEIEARLDPEVWVQVSELMGGDGTEGEGMILMLQHKIDYVQMYTEQIHRQFENLKRDSKPVTDLFV
jgi:hypothetical protein